MIILYYNPSEKRMIIRNTTPSKEWIDIIDRTHTCQFFIERFTVQKGFVSSANRGEGQNITGFALSIDIIGEPGDEYDG